MKDNDHGKSGKYRPAGVARAAVQRGQGVAMPPAFVRAAAGGWTPVATVAVGEFSLSHLGGGVYWLTNGDGEGLATKREKLEAALRKFWEKEF
jgi:DNA-binding transcriptional LysR family regulator